MVKGSKHTPGTLKKFRDAKLGKPGNPHKKGIPISKNATVVCIDCGIVITGTTINRKRCPDCKKKISLGRGLKFKQDHIEKIREENSAYWKHIRMTNPERRDILNQRNREWRIKNPQRFYEMVLKYNHAHPEYKKAWDNRRRALKLNAQGSHTNAEFNILCESLGWECSYCGKSLNIRTASRDHKIPLSRGGNDSIDNITLSCIRCNSVKNAKTFEEFIMVKEAA